MATATAAHQDTNRVGNLTGVPFTDIVWVIDHGCLPHALVLRVGLVRSHPLPTTWCSITCGIGTVSYTHLTLPTNREG